MTENEAIERLKCMRLFMQINDKASDSKFLEEDYIANKMAIKALEEIQQYRTIGTVEEIKKVVQFLSLDNDNGIIEDLQLLNKYQFIGTVEECREARERQKGKKPEFELNLGDYTSRFICGCGKRLSLNTIAELWIIMTLRIIVQIAEVSWIGLNRCGCLEREGASK